MNIPFNIPPQSLNESLYIAEAIKNKKLNGEGPFNKRCANWFNVHLPTLMTVITPSCTSALEMAMVLAEISPGDEVILPSFTFTSTANVVALYGGTPVFVDVHPSTMNIDVTRIEAAVTPRTKMIIPVHYAGVACEMDKIMDLAQKYNLWVVEDAAQSIFAAYKGKSLGSWGHMAAFSFHDTKNITCGEGGALTINDKKLLSRVEIVRDKGTNRQQFLNGEVDKYTWQDKGSSYLLSELAAAFLCAQLEDGPKITERRLQLWKSYHEGLKDLESQGHLRRMQIPADCQANGHIYYFLVDSEATRIKLFTHLKERGIQAVSHYVPLHSAPAGIKYGRTVGELEVTTHQAACLVRLPMFVDLTKEQQTIVLQAVHDFFKL